MGARLDEFRKEVEKRRNGQKKGSTAYPSTMRAFAVGFAKKKLATGASFSAVVKELGVSAPVLARWMRDKEGGGFKRVRIGRSRDFESSVSLRLVTRSGVTVEGLDVKSAAELVLALS
jgi:hypothetical protein